MNMQTDRRADKKESFTRNTGGFSVRGKSLSSSKPGRNVGQERHVHRGISKDDNTLTYEKRLKTYSSVTVVDKAGSGTQVQGAAKAPRKPKDSRNENLNVIKSRILGRKYAQLWLHLTFGKTSPQLARKLNETHLMKKVFTAWKEDWWEARREWKLNIRAECHSRYRLWLKVWQAWRQYLKLEQIEKHLFTKAVSHCNKSSLRVTFNAWRNYTDLKKTEKILHSQVALSSYTLLKRRCFNIWLKRLDMKHQISKLESTALHHWAYNLLLKAWVQWRNELQQRMSLHQRMDVLIWNHRVRSLRNCWDGWSLYMEHCKAKKRNKGIADEQYNLSLLSHHFDQWLKRHKRAQEIALFHEQLASKERVAKCRRVFLYWKHYIVVKCYYRKLKEISEDYYTRNLKALAFRGLQSFLNFKQHKEANGLLAIKHRRNMLLSSYWDCWIKRCEHSEEIKMLPQSRLAFNHFRKVRLVQYITKWKHYIVWRRHRKEQYCIANKHFSSKLLPKILEAFRQHIEICHYKCQIVSAADNFRRENLLSMVFYQWWRSYIQHQDVRMMERMAILHSEETTKRNILYLWRWKTKVALERNYLQGKADDHNCYRVLSKILCHWKLFCQLSKHKREIKFKATISYRIKLLRLTWNGWEKYLLQQRRKHQQWEKAYNHYSLTLTKKVFSSYQCYHKQQLIKKGMNNQAFSFNNRHVMRRLCKSWKVFVLQQREIRSMKMQASLYYDGKLLSKVWNKWRHTTKYQVSIRQMEENKVIDFQKHIQHNQMMRVFYMWKYQRDQRVVDRLKWERSVCLHGQTLLQKCFIAWLQYYHLKLRKLSLKQKSLWFHDNRLKSVCYSQWRLQLMRVLIYRQKNTLVLWQWSQTLQRKVIVCWLEYAKYRKQRQQQYNNAVDYYRKSLLHIGVTEWIRVATWQAAQRQERALEKQTKTVQSTMMCVRRCAQHWRKWAHARSLQRPKRSADQRQHWNTPSSHRVISGINTEWIDLVKKFNIPVTAGGTTTAQKRRLQPRKPNFLASINFIGDQSNTNLEGITVEQSAESVPREQVFPFSHPNITQDEEFSFLPSSASEASLIAVNTCEDQQLLDLCMKRKASSDVSLKQPKVVPLPPSAFEFKQPDSSKWSPSRLSQNDIQVKQQKVSSEEMLQTDKPQSINELVGFDVKPKNLTLHQEILYITKFLRKYYSVKEKLRIIEDKIKHLMAAGGSARSSLKQLQKEQVSISSALELHKPLMLRMVARSNELQMHYK